jgi:hypothetical protein
MTPDGARVPGVAVRLRVQMRVPDRLTPYGDRLVCRGRGGGNTAHMTTGEVPARGPSPIPPRALSQFAERGGSSLALEIVVTT